MDKHSGKIHVWACISFLGKICVRTFRENNNADVYCSLLQDGFQGLADSIYGGRGTWVFQHDNSPIHTAKKFTDLLNEVGIPVLAWPSKSPDLNPIENIWTLLKQRVRKRLPKTLDELEEYIYDAWWSIDDMTISDLCNSIHSRIEKCIKARGGQVEY
jgi:transposase